MALARICPLCDKRPRMVVRRMKLRGKHNPTTQKRKFPNLQWARLPRRAAEQLGVAEGARVKICTQCLKGLHKTPKDRTSRSALRQKTGV